LVFESSTNRSWINDGGVLEVNLYICIKCTRSSWVSMIVCIGVQETLSGTPLLWNPPHQETGNRMLRHPCVLQRKTPQADMVGWGWPAIPTIRPSVVEREGVEQSSRRQGTEEEGGGGEWWSPRSSPGDCCCCRCVAPDLTIAVAPRVESDR
jgi:hypothetical protein